MSRIIELAVKRSGTQIFAKPRLIRINSEAIIGDLRPSTVSGASTNVLVNKGTASSASYDAVESVAQIRTQLDEITSVDILANPLNKTTGITAGATQTQAGATLLTSYINVISTCATAQDGVRLPTAVAGLLCVIINNGAAAAKVWPFSGDAIDGGTVNAGVASAVPVGGKAHYYAVDATNWVTVTTTNV